MSVPSKTCSLWVSPWRISPSWSASVIWIDSTAIEWILREVFDPERLPSCVDQARRSVSRKGLKHAQFRIVIYCEEDFHQHWKHLNIVYTCPFLPSSDLFAVPISWIWHSTYTTLIICVLDTDILRFGIPSTSPIYDIMLSLAEYRTAVTRHRSSTTASSPPLSQHMSNSVSMESRTVNNQSRVRLVITPRTRLPDNSRGSYLFMSTTFFLTQWNMDEYHSCSVLWGARWNLIGLFSEPPTVIEVTSPLQSSSVSSAPVVPHISVELRKASGFINSDDIKTVELALYLGESVLIGTARCLLLVRDPHSVQ